MASRQKNLAYAIAASAVAAFVIGWTVWSAMGTSSHRWSTRVPSDSVAHVATLAKGREASARIRPGITSPGKVNPRGLKTDPADSNQIQTVPRHQVAARVDVMESFFPRDPDEWQGALVPNSPKDMGQCLSSAGCGLALACKGNLCGACVLDRDCAPGERCVLDHCLVESNATCGVRRDCMEGEVCMLTDDGSEGPRLNDKLRSICWSSEHPPSPRRPHVEVKVSAAPKEHLVDADEMIQALRRDDVLP